MAPAAGDLLVVWTADEERGAEYGARWLCEERPDLVRATSSSTRAGGACDRPRRGACTPWRSAKRCRCSHLAPTVRAGHASIPRIGDNAVLKMAPLWSGFRISRRSDPPRGVQFLSALLDEDLT